MVSNGMRGMPGAVAVDAAEARPGAAVRDALDGGRGEAAGEGECAVEIEIPVRLVSLLNSREHHMARARRAKQQRSLARLQTIARLCRSPLWARVANGCGLVVTITRIGPRELDDDNLAGSAKHVRDGIADALGIDDGDKRIVWRYRQAKFTGAARGGYSCAVRIEQKGTA